jgi:putative ABC transport system permease protein
MFTDIRCCEEESCKGTKNGVNLYSMKIPNLKPPEYARKILISFLRNDLAEEVQGDLEENFYTTVKNKSPLRAQLNYWYQVMNYLRPFAIRKTKNIYINDYAMFQNYFKIGWRNMKRNVGYTFINVGGLAVGMAVAILNGLWIWDELSFNKYYENYDRIAQVGIRGENEDGIWRGVTVTYPMGTELIEKYHGSLGRRLAMAVTKRYSLPERRRYLLAA